MAFSSKRNRATEYLELVQSDVCGPINVLVRKAHVYFKTFMDDFYKSISNGVLNLYTNAKI